MAKKQKQRIRRPDAYGVRAVARMNRAEARKAPVVIPIAVHHDPVEGPVVVVAEDIPVKRVPRQNWMDFLLGRGKQ